MQIKKLKIYSSKVKAQAEFYSKMLGLETIHETNESVSLKIGNSSLQIDYQPKTTPYHFAINIPANKEEEALEWLKSKVSILKDGENEIQDFDFWNAKAIYFYDEDYNIVELIARKNLGNNSDDVFGVKQWLEISEIGVPVLDVEKTFNRLNKLTEIEIFSGDLNRFCAIGNEHGLFICINKKIKDWFPTNDKAFSSPFEIKLIEKGVQHQIEFKNGDITALTLSTK